MSNTLLALDTHPHYSSTHLGNSECSWMFISVSGFRVIFYVRSGPQIQLQRDCLRRQDTFKPVLKKASCNSQDSFSIRSSAAFAAASSMGNGGGPGSGSFLLGAHWDPMEISIVLNDFATLLELATAFHKGGNLYVEGFPSFLYYRLIHIGWFPWYSLTIRWLMLDDSLSWK